jgi:hypothetical protein
MEGLGEFVCTTTHLHSTDVKSLNSYDKDTKKKLKCPVFNKINGTLMQIKNPHLFRGGGVGLIGKNYLKRVLRVIDTRLTNFESV